MRLFRKKNDDMLRDIRETLRATGTPELIRRWEKRGLLPALWAALRPIVQTRAFENAADYLRAEAVRAAAGPAGVFSPLSEPDRRRLGPLLELHHYLNAKLLLIASAVRAALQNDGVERLRSYQDVERVERGVPARMAVCPAEDIPLWPKEFQRHWKDQGPLFSGAALAPPRLRETARFLLRLFPRPLILPADAFGAAVKAALLESVLEAESALATAVFRVAAMLPSMDSPFPPARRVAFTRENGSPDGCFVTSTAARSARPKKEDSWT